jgi:hypothetical protein
MLTEEEFKQAVTEAVETAFDDVWGPVDFDALRKRKDTKFAAPQTYLGTDVSTRESIMANIGSMYADSNGFNMPFTPRYGSATKYCNGVNFNNFPQCIKHKVLGDVVYNLPAQMTVRILGCHVFVINQSCTLPRWLSGLLTFFCSKYKEIMADVPKRLSEEESAKLVQWREPSPDLAKTIGPTKELYSDLWCMMAKTQLAEHNAKCEAKLTEVKRQLAELSAKMVAFLEKIPFKPKYGGVTNCADAMIMAVPE